MNGDLLMAVYDTVGAMWTVTPLDAQVATDTGQWSSLGVAADGSVHVAFQDAVEDSLRYLTWTAGTISGIEMVDDGIRSQDRNHPVGAASAVIIEPSGTVAIVYQDAAQSDLLFARRDGAGVWTHGDLLAGEPGYGFYNAAVSEGRPGMGRHLRLRPREVSARRGVDRQPALASMPIA